MPDSLLPANTTPGARSAPGLQFLLCSHVRAPRPLFFRGGSVDLHLAALTLAIALTGLTVLVLARVAIAAPSQQVPIGPRAIGMAGAFTSLADDASALFWNPAGLTAIGHQQLMASHADLFGAGINDNVAAFALPLSPDQAAAMDWYHSGFSDNELGFAENRVDLGLAFKLTHWLTAGVNGKLLTRGTDLNGSSISSGRGYGMDLGFLATASEQLHFGFVAQDLFNTSVTDDAGASDEVYPRNVRLGASYAYRSWGTAALDVDDRWHLGLEFTPIEACALRVGTEDDLQGDEGNTWTYGLGLKAGIFRVDWALVQHPTLEATNYFALSMDFNFNPAQVRVEKVETAPLYTSLYKSYAQDPMGTVQVRNLRDVPLETRVSVYVPELMDAPSETNVLLRPKATQLVPLTGVLSEHALSQRGDQPVQIQIKATYQSQRVARTESATGRTVAYAPGAIDWSAGTAQAAAFVTTRDPAVDGVARNAGRQVALEARDPFGNRNVSFAAAMVDVCAELGVAYVPDPNNPYSAMAETERAVDTIHYPYQTLARRSGDCDDTTVLLASLLGNVGVPTRFVDAPGHIFLLASAGLHPSNQLALGVDSTMYVIADDEVWIPIETTALGKGFAEAWRTGAEEIASWSVRGELQYVDVATAQGRYEPALPPGDRTVAPIDDAKLLARIQADAAQVAAWRRTFTTARYGAAAQDLAVSAEAQSDVAHMDLLGGEAGQARTRLESALTQAPQSVALHNNLGVVLAGLDSLPAAEAQWRTALALGGNDAGLWLNLGLARWAQGDSLGSVEPLARGIASAGSADAALRLMGLDGSPTDVLTARLSGLVRGVPAAAVTRAAQAGAVPPAGTARPGSRPFASGSELHHYLHWIE